MNRTHWTAAVCLVGSLACLGCSDDDVIDPQAAVEGQVTGVMALVRQVLVFLDPFAPAPPAAQPLGDPCTDVSQNVCVLGGTVEQCDSTTFNFTDCRANSPSGSIGITGSWVYASKTDWPTGNGTINLFANTGPFVYDLTTDGTAAAIVGVSGDDVIADCDVDLDTLATTCMILDEMDPLF